jgi:hypothetical protein
VPTDELQGARELLEDDRLGFETVAFLEWLLDLNFIFLGYREYELASAKGEDQLRPVAGSELGILRVLDPPDIIRRKLRSAVTDTGKDVVRSETKPGITNLIEIMAVATDVSIGEVESRYDGAGYGQFKDEVGEAVVTLLTPFRERYEELRADEHPQLPEDDAETAAPKPKRTRKPAAPKAETAEVACGLHRCARG